MTATLRSPFNLSAHLRPTIGDQKMSYVGVDHMGWLLCDGRQVSRTTYALLFNVIGETFGVGDGSTTFNLPNPVGRVIGAAGPNSTSGLTTRAIGASVGAETHTLTIAEMPTHNHEVTDPGHSHTYRFPTSQNAGTLSPTTNVAEDNFALGVEYLTSNQTTGISIQNRGESNAHNNMQPTLFAGNMFMYSGRNMDAYFPYTWVNSGTPTPPAYNPATSVVPGKVLIF